MKTETKKHMLMLYMIVAGLTLQLIITNICLVPNILKLEKENKELKAENEKLSRDVTTFDIDQKLKVNLIQRRVTWMHRFLKSMYPGYDYQQKFDAAVDSMDKDDFNKKLKEMPINLLFAYVDNYLIKDHGLKNYKLSIPNTIYPVDPENAYVTDKEYEFGCKHRFEGIHTGTDINNKGEAQVLATYNGIIWSVKYDKYGGNTVELKYNIEVNGKKEWIFDRYRHISNVYVKEGQYVKKGNPIATIGSTGLWVLGGRHLHFERWKLVDPKTNKWININPFMNGTYGNKWKERN